jgi:drug/metabolite transporter (DMT)-like permease
LACPFYAGSDILNIPILLPFHDRVAASSALAVDRQPAPMNVVQAILLKLLSVLLFAIMSGLVRFVGQEIGTGQVMFFRSAFAILPIAIIYAWRGEIEAAVRTGRFFGHLGRGLIGLAGMFFSFASLSRLPLVDATAIGFAAPLITVALAALVLKERVRLYRWSAVAVGFVGVITMLWPFLHHDWLSSGSTVQTIGAVFALCSALTSAASVVQTRRLTDSETTSSIVFYFALVGTVFSAMTLPFNWHTPTGGELTALITIGVLGGLSHIFLTESYRYAPASVVASFDYTSMLWAFLIGYFFFGELPTIHLFIGGAIVVLSGLFVIWRERQLGIRRERERVMSSQLIAK